MIVCFGITLFPCDYHIIHEHFEIDTIGFK